MTSAAPYVVLVTGLAFESRLVPDSPHIRKCCGQGAYLVRLLDEAIDDGCRGILSFGIAAGLDPALAAGALVIPTEVRSGAKAFPADAAWRSALCRLCPPAVQGAVCGEDEPVLSPAEKARIFRASGAVALDMESHLVARTAAERSIPFAVVRAASDDAARTVPPISMEGLRDDGTTDPGRLALALLREPSSLPSLMAVAFGTWRARRVLTRAGRLLGPGLGLLDIG